MGLVDVIVIVVVVLAASDEVGVIAAVTGR